LISLFAQHIYLGAGVDSFYEYLLKIWLYKNKTDTSMLRIYLDAIKPVREKLITKSSSGMWFVGDKEENSGLIQAMSHLACFSGGMFALTYLYVNSLNETERNEYKKLATEITATCHQSYIRAETHLGPEVFHFYGNNEAIGANKNENYYILRPEVVEAYFYMWRMTHYQIYRDWAWDVVLSLEKHCKTPNGYQGLINVYESTTTKDDTQQSIYFNF
jgi:mannosyl-oligosaccharide alpha-1,2-mannosidase